MLFAPVTNRDFRTAGAMVSMMGGCESNDDLDNIVNSLCARILRLLSDEAFQADSPRQTIHSHAQLSTLWDEDLRVMVVGKGITFAEAAIVTLVKKVIIDTNPNAFTMNGNHALCKLKRLLTVRSISPAMVDEHMRVLQIKSGMYINTHDMYFGNTMDAIHIHDTYNIVKDTERNHIDWEQAIQRLNMPPPLNNPCLTRLYLPIYYGAHMGLLIVDVCTSTCILAYNTIQTDELFLKIHNYGLTLVEAFSSFLSYLLHKQVVLTFKFLYNKASGVSILTLMDHIKLSSLWCETELLPRDRDFDDIDGDIYTMLALAELHSRGIPVMGMKFVYGRAYKIHAQYRVILRLCLEDINALDAGWRPKVFRGPTNTGMTPTTMEYMLCKERT